MTYKKSDELFKELSNLIDAATSAVKRDDGAAALRDIERALGVAKELPKREDKP